MVWGIRAWDSSGRTILDTTTRTSRILGQFNISSLSGSYTVPQLFDGTLYCHPARGLVARDPTRPYSQPGRLWVEGGTIYWEEYPWPQFPTVIYGVLAK